MNSKQFQEYDVLEFYPTYKFAAYGRMLSVAIFAMECPVCNASPGEHCISKSRKRVPTHATRSKLGYKFLELCGIPNKLQDEEVKFLLSKR